jgi:GNAT superfamily N-acetyltransferase
MEQLGYPVPLAQVEKRLERLAERRVVFVAAVEGGIAGWTSVCADETLIEGLEACIEGLVVDEQVRSRGIGLRLLHAAEQWAKERGCVNLIVRSNVVRTRAHAFYERNGFATIKAQQFLRKRL